MTQRVRRAERKAKQRTGDRGLVYRGAEAYDWIGDARRGLARYGALLADDNPDTESRRRARNAIRRHIGWLLRETRKRGAADLFPPQPWEAARG